MTAVIERTDAVVLARMRAAAQTLRAAGLEVPGLQSGSPEDADREALLRRAVHWQRFSAGPVPEPHRAGAVDLARGSLRLWSLAGGTPEPLSRPIPTVTREPTRAELHLARIQLSAAIRSGCSALRAELAAQAATLSRRGVGVFEAVVRVAMLKVAGELDNAVTDRLAGLGLRSDGCPPPDIADLLPPRRRPRLENQLTALFGAGFGAGMSLTLGRLLAQVRPESMPAAGLFCGLLGIVVTLWSVLGRRLLAERAAAERWSADAVANLRPALEERLLIRTLTAEWAGN